MNENLVQKSINITFNSFYFFIHWMFGCCVCSRPKCSGFEGGEQVRINYVVEISGIFPHQTAFLLPSFVSNWRKNTGRKKLASNTLVSKMVVMRSNINYVVGKNGVGEKTSVEILLSNASNIVFTALTHCFSLNIMNINMRNAKRRSRCFVYGIMVSLWNMNTMLGIHFNGETRPEAVALYLTVGRYLVVVVVVGTKVKHWLCEWV